MKKGDCSSHSVQHTHLRVFPRGASAGFGSLNAIVRARAQGRTRILVLFCVRGWRQLKQICHAIHVFV